MNETQKKILYITSRADIGGGPLSLKWLIESLKKNNDYQLEIFVAAPSGQYFSQYYRENSQDFFSLPFRAFTPFALFGLISFIKKHKITNIHSMGRGASIYGVSCALLFCSRKIKWLHTFHGLHYENNFAGLIKKLLDQIVFTYFISCVFTLNAEEKKNAHDILNILEKKIFPIRNYVSGRVIQYRLTRDKAKLKELWSIPQGKIIVGMLGRNDPVKGLSMLQQKIIEVEKYFPDRFYFIDAKEIKPEEFGAWGFLSVIDIYISHSFREGAPLVILESLELGCACLLSDIVGHREFGLYHSAANKLDFFSLQSSGKMIGEKLLKLFEKGQITGPFSDVRLAEESHLKTLLSQYV